MTRLAPTLLEAFSVAASELGFCSAARLFCREVDSLAGESGVRALRDALGRTYPVLDAVCAAWLDGERDSQVDVLPVQVALRGAAQVLVVGYEADALDALVPALPEHTLHLLCPSPAGDPAWERILANYPGRLHSIDLLSFQRLAGRQTAVLCLLYGVTEATVHVPPAWLRLSGDDVRAQFRTFIGWDVLRRPMYVYPRWLTAVPHSEFARIL